MPPIGWFAHRTSDRVMPVAPQEDRAVAESMETTIETESGERVSAVWLLPERPQAFLSLAHGAGVGMRHPAMAAVAEGLCRRGIATLRFQFPYMERGARRPDTPAVAQRTLRAAAAAASERAGGRPLYAGGRSYGGRMTSLAQAAEPLAGVRGLVFFAFPLHAAGKPSSDRAAHLAGVTVPMLFLQGTRDALASIDLLQEVVDRLGQRAVLELADQADHSFHVPAQSGRTDEEVLGAVLDRAADWMAS